MDCQSKWLNNSDPDGIPKSVSGVLPNKFDDFSHVWLWHFSCYSSQRRHAVRVVKFESGGDSGPTPQGVGPFFVRSARKCVGIRLPELGNIRARLSHVRTHAAPEAAPSTQHLQRQRPRCAQAPAAEAPDAPTTQHVAPLHVAPT